MSKKRHLKQVFFADILITKNKYGNKLNDSKPYDFYYYITWRIIFQEEPINFDLIT